MYSKFSSMGRSMIEMLGVLAIIGVVSIGALVGFQYALNKHKANETLNDIQLWALQAVEAEQTYPIGQTIPTDDIGYTSSQGYNIAAVAAGDNLFAVELMNVPQKVCALLLKMAQNEYTIELTTAEMGSGTLFAGNTDECKDKPTLYFYFNTNLKKPTEVCLPGCDTGESCCNNACYPTEGLCGNLCACPTGTECKGDGLCCLPESEACNGTCCPATQVCTNAGCACPEGAILNEEEQCVCPTDSILVDNKCQSVLCTGSGSNYTCTDIYGNRCGTNCNEDGSVCNYGFCLNYCPSGTIYSYNADVNIYGCKNTDLKTFCHRSWNSGTDCRLYEQNSVLCASGCSLDATSCTGYGNCQNICPSDLFYQPVSTHLGSFYGCYSKEKDVACLQSGFFRKYECKKNNLLCGTSCDVYGQNCTAGYCDETPCLNGNPMETFNNKWSCLNENGTYCWAGDGYYNCGFIDSKEECGGKCQNNGTNCVYGSCGECPEGYTFIRVKKNVYGCQKNDTNITCLKNISYSNYLCYKDETICGSNCNIDGTVCKSGSCSETFK